MKFIKVHDLYGNTVLVNLEKVAAIRTDDKSELTQIAYCDGMFGLCKETVQKLADLILGN